MTEQSDMIPTLKVGEIIKINNKKYQIIEEDKLDVVTLTKNCALKVLP